MTDMMKTTHSRLFRSLASALVFSAFALAGAAVHAQCPDKHEAVGERLFNQGGAAFKVQLCWNPQGDSSVAGGTLRVMAYQGERLAAEASFPVDVEGQVRAIKFDRANYPINAKMPTFPVLVEARSRGATFDQYTTDLWLITLDAGKLKKVFAQNVAWESWGTQCEPDCIETTKSKTVVIVAPEKSAQGLSDLKLRARGKTTPYGKDEKAAVATDETTRYVFTGEQYEPKQ
jgi:frataxin-like iron-binding protein CyaY